jgi:hypothetical protein
MLDELLIALWMPTFAQTSKLFSLYAAVEAPIVGELPLPLTMPLLIAAPVVLSFGSELARMIRPCLSSRQRFGDGQHSLGPARQRLVTVLVQILPQVCG